MGIRNHSKLYSRKFLKGLLTSNLFLVSFQHGRSHWSKEVRWRLFGPKRLLYNMELTVHPAVELLLGFSMHVNRDADYSEREGVRLQVGYQTPFASLYHSIPCPKRLEDSDFLTLINVYWGYGDLWVKLPSKSEDDGARALHVKEFFLGKRAVKNHEGESFPVCISLPDGEYKGHARIIEYTDSYSRVPSALRRKRRLVDVVFDDGLPYAEGLKTCFETAFHVSHSNPITHREAEDLIHTGIIKMRDDYDQVGFLYPHKKVKEHK